MEEKIHFATDDGLRLCGIWSKPDKTTNKAIILAHGITVDKDESGVFIDLAQALVREGIAVLRFDFRGHGESAGNSVDLTVHGELMDVDAAVKETLHQGYKEVCLLGASFGGSITTLYAARNPGLISRLCLWNPVLDYDHTFLHPTLPWIKDKKEHMKREFDKQGWTRLGSHNMKVGRGLFESMEQLKPYEALRAITCPIMIIHGDNDLKVPYEDSARASQGLHEVTLMTIKGAGHGFHVDWEEDEAITYTVQFIK